MFSRALRVGVLTVCASLCTLLLEPSPARADEECPIGSVMTTEKGQSWCQPNVCENDTQCATGSVCRPVPLCVEVGTLEQSPGSKEDAGQKLMVRQRCGADKTCPQRTTCSEKGRCITRAQADKAGLLTPPGAASGATSPQGAEAPKKACGCHVPGTTGGELGGAALAMLGVIAIGARRRARTHARTSKIGRT